MSVVVSVNRAAIAEILHGEGSGGHVHRFVRQKAREVRRVAKAKAPKRTGRLAASIDTSPVIDTPRRVRIRVGAGVRYGIWVEEGTGIYAGRGRIRTTKKAMVFLGSQRARNGSRIGRRGRNKGRVFAKSVAGQRGQHYMRDALLEVCAVDPRLRARIVAR